MATHYNTVGETHSSGERHAIGIAHIIIPSDVERSVYITECYRTSTVSIYSESNGVTNKVPVDQHSIQLIKFPYAVNEFGSAVSFKVDPIRKRPCVDGIYFKDNEVSDLRENQFKTKSEFKGDYVEVTGSPVDKYLLLSVNADKAGNMNMTVQSGDESGLINIKVDGDTHIKSLNNTNLKQYSRFNSTTTNRNDDSEFASLEQDSISHTFYDESHNINTEKLSVNNGEEPWVLGKQWAQFMKDLIKEIGSATVSTAIGQMPLLNADQINQYSDKVDKLLSQIAFIDK
jgi:hypothetical protein